jgi:hypothetical protein
MQRVEPSGELELKLHAIWVEVLGHHDFGVTDDFFDIGGHSLHAARLISRIEFAFGTAPSLFSFFQYSTIATLAPLLVPLDPEADSGRPAMHIPVVEPICVDFQ